METKDKTTLEILKRQFELCIETENYEKCAELKKEIREITLFETYGKPEVDYDGEIRYSRKLTNRWPRTF